MGRRCAYIRNGHQPSGIGHQKGDAGPEGATTGARIVLWGDACGAPQGSLDLHPASDAAAAAASKTDRTLRFIPGILHADAPEARSRRGDGPPA